ncbi:MAG: DUF2130 domain-containing protein [Fimbriimonadaceae bacterium]
MSDKLIVDCPKCGHAFPLDETLASPLVAKVRQEAEERVRQVREEAARAEAALAAKERELAEKEASLQAMIDKAVASQRLEILEQARKEAQATAELQLEAERKRAEALQAELEEAQRAELQLRAERDAVQKRANEIELEVRRKLDAERQALLEQATAEAEDRLKLLLAEKDKTIQDMQGKLEEAQRKAAQGSQQLQGEILELDLEATLRQNFPLDTFEAVKSGSRGGDILQRVLGEMGRPAGTIFWEAKRTQAWSGDWTAKAKQDAANERAEIAVIVSEVLPKSFQDFGLFEGVWVALPRYAVPLAFAIRQGLIEAHHARVAAQGRESKAERVYSYLTSSDFRAVVAGIAQPFVDMQNDLISEKRATLARWKKRERQIQRVLENVAALQGDLQAIAGEEMGELPEFADPALPDGLEPEGDEEPTGD